MRNSIAFLGSILICSLGFGQEIRSIDTLHFTTEKSYSRIVARYSKNELVFGTSKTGVILYNEKTKQVKTLIQPVSCGEFRDLIVNGKKIYTCVSGDSAIIYKINGKKITELYRDRGFIDDLVLKGKRNLVMLSDPLIETNLIVTRIDVNKSTVYAYGPFKGVKGEAFYAASGTTSQLIGETYYFVSGGPNNATFYSGRIFGYEPLASSQLPLPKAEGAGPFSIFMLDEKNGVIVGGNYTKPNMSDSTAVYTTNGGLTWHLSEKQPNGYRSCVTGDPTILFSCGTNGIDYSSDGGKTWSFFAAGNFCALLLEKNTLYATTNKGYCLRIHLKFKMEN
ncbi:sialidase family protein [Fluviicola sp.]|uniref:sialidase family protein n=1 Tax=Fluviicola sp. TaxID=1917219 RepID=UPI0026113F7B|nr:sialidase family protein [Fluviicola sp.]